MCPACIASATVVVSGVVSTGGVTALAVKLFRGKRNPPAAANHTDFEPQNISTDSIERRNDDGYSNR